MGGALSSANTPFPTMFGYGTILSIDIRALPPTSVNKVMIYERKLTAYIRIFGTVIPIPLFPTKRVEVANMLPLDGAPGGTTNIPGDNINISLFEFDLGFGVIRSRGYDDGSRERLRTTFIPTVSALDIQTTNVFLNVSNQQSLVTSGFVGSRSSSQFDVARFIEVAESENRIANQVHAGLSYRTTGFLLYELITRNALQGSPTTSNVLLNNRTYNFASNSEPYANNLPQPNGFQPRSMTNIIDYTLDVDKEGQLWINRGGKIGFTDDATSPTNAGTNTNYSLIIRQGEGCRSGTDNKLGIVNITKSTFPATGGIVRVGDASTPSNKANIRILRGGTMNITPGGTVILENVQSYISVEDGGLMTLSGVLELKGLQSKVIVKKGGKLVINTNANIKFTGNNPSIVVELGGEIVFNGNPTLFAGTGSFVFMPGHILKLNTNLKLKGSGKTIPLIYLPYSTLDGPNTLKIIESSIEIENAQIKYDANAQIEIRHSNSPLQSVKFTDVSFVGTSFFNTRAVNCINPKSVNLLRCNFSNLDQGLVVNKTISGSSIVALDNTEFNYVCKGISVADDPNLGVSTTIATVINSRFFYDGSSIALPSGSTACKFENILRAVFNGGNQFLSNRSYNHTAVELKNSELQTYGNNVISKFKMGINAEIGQNNLDFGGGIDVNNCETGIILTGSPGNASYGILTLWCSKIKNNLTGIKGTNIRFDGGINGRQIGAGNEFENAPNGLLFDICYPVLLGGSPLSGNISASNNYWVGGFNSMKFNIKIGQNSSCDINGFRRNLEQCSVLTLSPNCANLIGIGNCCNTTVYTNDGSGNNAIVSYTKYCATGGGGGGTNDALIMRKPALPQSSLNGKELADSDEKTFAIYPNPANETVKLDIESGNYTLKVINTVGQTIFAQNTEGSLSVNVSTWTNGVYLFEVTNKATNKQQRSKIVVQH
jgi:hypothetical protein